MAELSEEQKKLYETIRVQFKEIKRGVSQNIGFLEKQIQNNKNYLANLRSGLKVPGAEKKCPTCELISMEYLGTFPSTYKTDLDEERETYSPVQKYKCLLCGHIDEEHIILDA